MQCPPPCPASHHTVTAPRKTRSISLQALVYQAALDVQLRVLNLVCASLLLLFLCEGAALPGTTTAAEQHAHDSGRAGY
eukprot:3170426-Rhodomonas_salina.3